MASMRHREDIFHDPEWQPPEVIYGEKLLPDFIASCGSFAVATMEIPWGLVKDDLPRDPEQLILVSDMRRESVVKLAKTIPDVEVVLGIGGGSSHDMAKYIALEKQCKLVQVPTILTSDAVVTHAIGLRDDWKVVYTGHVCPEKILVDFTLLEKAPPALIRWGVSDILSSHTALHDWKLASRAGKEQMHKGFFHEARNIVHRIYENRGEIRGCTREGIRLILDCYLGFSRIENLFSSPRAQEGSEHFFAYCAEAETRRPFIHGQLLSTGIAAMSWLQENGFQEITGLFDDMGVEYRGASLGIPRDVFARILYRLPDFVRSGWYYHSVIDEKPMDHETVEALMDTLYRATSR